MLSKLLAITSLSLGLSLPAVASERMWHGSDNVRTYLEVKERTKDVVVLESSFYIGKKQMGTSDKIILDCPNKTMVVDTGTFQNIWKADGNLWYTDSFGERKYSSNVAVDYNFGCLGELPDDGHTF